MELKRSVLRLRRISAKQMDIFYRMSRGEIHLIPQQMLPFYRDIYDHLIRVTDLARITATCSAAPWKLISQWSQIV
jgi:magnesium transporter